MKSTNTLRLFARQILSRHLGGDPKPLYKLVLEYAMKATEQDLHDAGKKNHGVAHHLDFLQLLQDEVEELYIQHHCGDSYPDIDRPLFTFFADKLYDELSVNPVRHSEQRAAFIVNGMPVHLVKAIICELDDDAVDEAVEVTRERIVRAFLQYLIDRDRAVQQRFRDHARTAGVIGS